MKDPLVLFAVKRVQYLDRRDVFYGATETGFVPPEVYAHPDDDGNNRLIKFFAALSDWYMNLEDYAKEKNWIEVEVPNIAEFHTSPLPRDMRWFAESVPVRTTFVRKNIQLKVELLNKLETFAGQNKLHTSTVIEAALEQYLNR